MAGAGFGGVQGNAVLGAADKSCIIVIMTDTNHIAERLASMRQEINDLKTTNARYWVKSQRTPLDKSAHSLRHVRLLGIKQELADMMKRCS
jgi:hypothetical protein